MPARIDPSTNANQQRFAALLAVGYSQSDAYQECFKPKGRKAENITSAAHKLASHPAIKSAQKAIVESLNLSAIDSANEAIIQLLQDIKQCRAEKAWPTLANLTRYRLQIHGLLKENISLTTEQSLTDEQLIERLAGKDQAKAAWLKGMLAPVTSFKRA